MCCGILTVQSGDASASAVANGAVAEAGPGADKPVGPTTCWSVVL